ncbi:hypothetical protein MFMK1_001466 [Metallumcola ferriviriculae]|uniref:Uncharacterized protein n=1 Tax=Metallumcola ferriviriculae TaxID=3039180 RepID=A0AAU0UKP3_9FIRM|nr:hypothetical protein MFMK1_001466 [Desulfitibacteraceae bacterium MK1]
MKTALTGSAIIWAAVIFGAAVAAPESFGKLIPILGGGAAAHVIILGSLARKKV